MYTALQKIHKEKDADPTEFEENVAQVMHGQHFELYCMLNCFRLLKFVMCL